MPDNVVRNTLQLNDLSISGFRGIAQVSISKLGRVTLLGGPNGVGKTTVLEAIRIYAARNNPNILTSVLREREEFSSMPDEDREMVEELPDYAALFHGRMLSGTQPISIGPSDERRALTLEVSALSELSDEQMRLIPDLPTDPDWSALKLTFHGESTIIPWAISQDGPLTPRARVAASRLRRHRRHREELSEPVKCESLGPGLLNNRDLAGLWDRVALTDDEDRATEALRLMHGDDVERVALIGSPGARYYERRPVVKLRDHGSPVPLKSLGDGSTRIFAAAMALATCRDGFLLLDEAENGIHHRIQEDFWRMILSTAHRNDVQVLATTHSWDCVKGFARAAEGLREIEGRYVRLERDGAAVRTIEYGEHDLSVSAEQGIEVR